MASPSVRAPSVRCVDEKAVVDWLASRGKGDAVRRTLSSEKKAELFACFCILAEAGADDGEHGVGVKTSELGKALSLLGPHAGEALRKMAPFSPAAASPGGSPRVLGFEEFSALMMALHVGEQRRPAGGESADLPVLELFPMLARAYDVRRTVDQAGARELRASGPGAVHEPPSAPRAAHARLERRGTGGRALSSTAAAGARSSGAAGSPSARGSSRGARPSQPLGGARRVYFWEAYTAYGEGYAAFRQARDQYEAKWVEGGATPSRPAEAAGGEPVCSPRAQEPRSLVPEEVLMPEELEPPERGEGGPRQPGGRGRRRVVGGPLPRALSHLGTREAVASAAGRAIGMRAEAARSARPAAHGARSAGSAPRVERREPGVGGFRRKPLGALQGTPRAPARREQAGKAGMQARAQAWHDLREGAREDSSAREETARLRRSVGVRSRERVCLPSTGRSSSLPLADDGVREFYA